MPGGRAAPRGSEPKSGPLLLFGWLSLPEWLHCASEHLYPNISCTFLRLLAVLYLGRLTLPAEGVPTHLEERGS